MRRIASGFFGISVALTAGSSALAQVAPTAQPAPAGAGGTVVPMQSANPVRVTVRDMASEGQLVRVPVNKSVLVDFSKPAKEVRLAKAEFAEVSAVSPTQLIVTGKAFGTTQLIATFQDGEQRVFDVAVDIELERLMASIRSAAPRAKVRAHGLMDSVVLTGEVPDADAADRIMQIAKIFSPQIVNQMRVSGTQQVLLRCTVAEVNRSATRQLGFNGWMAGENLRDMFAVSNLDQINPANIGAAAGASAVGTIPMVVGSDGIPITNRPTLSFGFPRAQMQVFIQALHENGLLRVLAEPNLVALNGQQASFLAGGEVPIPIATDERISVEFKEFGVRLNFTPTVLSENNIRLKVAPEISEPDFTNSVTLTGFTIPGFTSRRVETMVEMGSGETIAIGGLLNDRVRAVSRAVPGLGEVPILGALFRSVDFQTDETELVVLVTPELAAPIGSDQITNVPGADYVAPNDFELYLMGQIDGKTENGLPKLQPRVNQGWPVKTSDLYRDSATQKLRGPVGPSSGEEGVQ